MFIIDDLLFTPLKMLTDILEQIRDMADNELYGKDKIKEELLRLELMLETGEITEDEYNKAEDILLKRLDEGDKYIRK